MDPLPCLLFLAALSGAADEDEFRYEVERLGWDLTERQRVPGVAVACLRGGKLAWFQGCGYADVAEEREVTAETVFNIGSISKTVAAWGLMRLVEQGELELDAPVERALTRWKLPASEFDAGGVTLRRLLSHTAGLSLHGYPGFWPGDELPTLEQSLGGATNGSGDVRIVLEPGTQWRYSGGGYTLAQLLLEEATGLDFAASMREHVLAPLGMERSDYGWTPRVRELAATPYDETGKPLPRGGPCFPELAAAGLQTTAGDLARFAAASMPAFRAPEAAPVLKLETIELMETPAPAAPGYGLGYEVRDEGGIRLVGHGGANAGWMARLTLAPGLGEGIVILTNGSNGGAVHFAIEKAWIAQLRARYGQDERMPGLAPR